MASREYLGVPLVDTPAELRRLLEASPVWGWTWDESRPLEEMIASGIHDERTVAILLSRAYKAMYTCGHDKVGGTYPRTVNRGFAYGSNVVYHIADTGQLYLLLICENKAGSAGPTLNSPTGRIDLIEKAAEQAVGELTDEGGIAALPVPSGAASAWASGHINKNPNFHGYVTDASQAYVRLPTPDHQEIVQPVWVSLEVLDHIRKTGEPAPSEIDLWTSLGMAIFEDPQIVRAVAHYVLTP